MYNQFCYIAMYMFLKSHSAMQNHAMKTIEFMGNMEFGASCSKTLSVTHRKTTLSLKIQEPNENGSTVIHSYVLSG